MKHILLLSVIFAAFYIGAKYPQFLTKIPVLGKL